MKKTIQQNIDQARQFLDEYEKNCIDQVAKASELIIHCYRNSGCVYLCGNGGSACDAQHVAGELIGRYRINREAMAATALTADMSVLTCIGNDFDFNEVFSKQVEGLVKPGDILWAFSCSGTSANIVNAVKKAKELGAKIIGFTGKPNTPLEQLSDACVWVDAPYAGPAQQVHEVAYHTICEIVEEVLFGSGKVE